MIKPVIQLERILKEQNDLYDKIYDLEKNKSDAIMNKDGNSLENYSKEQENLLEKILKLENERATHIEDYVKYCKIDDVSSDITLKQIILSMDEDSSHHLLRLGMELKDKLIKLQELQDTNTILINDNIEFYNILISSLKSSTSIKSGYSSEGKEEEKVTNSVLFNQQA